MKGQKRKRKCRHSFNLIEKRLDENGCEVYEFFCHRCLTVVVAKVDRKNNKISGQNFNLGEGSNL